jgi:chorismate mutase
MGGGPFCNIVSISLLESLSKRLEKARNVAQEERKNANTHRTKRRRTKVAAGVELS